jgi:hypothetical protein
MAVYVIWIAAVVNGSIVFEKSTASALVKNNTKTKINKKR